MPQALGSAHPNSVTVILNGLDEIPLNYRRLRYGRKASKNFRVVVLRTRIAEMATAATQGRRLARRRSHRGTRHPSPSEGAWSCPLRARQGSYPRCVTVPHGRHPSARELGRRTSRSRNHNLCTLAAGRQRVTLLPLLMAGRARAQGGRGEGDEDARVDGDQFGDALAPGEPGPDQLVGVAAVGFGAGRADGGAAVPARGVDHPVRQGVGVEGGQDLAGRGVHVSDRAVQADRPDASSRPRQPRTASESSRRGRPGRAAPRAERDQAVTQLPWRPVLSESPRYRREVRHFPLIAASLTGQAAGLRCAAHTVAPADRGDAAAWRQVCPADSITAHAECHQPVQCDSPSTGAPPTQGDGSPSGSRSGGADASGRGCVTRAAVLCRHPPRMTTRRGRL